MYDTSNGQPVWHSGTNGRAAGGRLELRFDGRLALIDADDAIVWTPPGSPPPADHLVLDDDGVLALLSPDRGRVWASHRSRTAPWPGWSSRPVTDVLRHGQVLRHATLRSPSGQYAFTVEDGGTARLTDRRSGACLFETGPALQLAGLVVGDDGVLRWLDADARPLQDPALDVQSSGGVGDELIVTDHGDVQLRDDAGRVLWSSARIGEARALRAASADQRFAAGDTPLVRTSFDDDAAWSQLVADVTAGDYDGVTAFVRPFSGPEDDGRGVDELARAVPEGTHPLLYVADAVTFTGPERHLLVIEVGPAEASLDPIRTFRATPAAIQTIEKNLSVASMDWNDFADHLDADDVYRGE